LISHTFINWKFGESTKAMWWTLLPMILARCRKKANGRLPSGYGKNEWGINFKVEKYEKKDKLKVVRATAETIVENATEGGRARLHELSNDSYMNRWGGSSPLFDPGNYTKDTPWRRGLERVVGIGLGEFDLLVIDEAHKSRGADSGLSKLLEEVVMSSTSARRLSMTATPVELDVSQWKQTLSRIGLEKKSLDLIMEDTRRYADAVKRVRQCPNNEDARLGYQHASKNFQDALSPYLLRRDKREDSAVQLFAERTGLPIHAYRQELEIAVETVSLPLSWRQVVCAAEALSVVARQAENSKAKRLRLTMGNGHGIASLMAQTSRNNILDKTQEEHDKAEQCGDAPGMASEVPDLRRESRVAWWLNVMTQTFSGANVSLFDHPAMHAAVRAIEATAAKGDKVLVFGKFTEPLRALVEILNAREMLRCLQAGQPWPQEVVHEGSSDNGISRGERAALAAAHKQMKCSIPLTEIDQRLKSQYREIKNSRERLRGSLIAKIEAGFALHRPDTRAKVLFNSFSESATRSLESGDGHPLALVCRAVYELLGTEIEKAEPADFADAFIQLLNALSDRDERDADESHVVVNETAFKIWKQLEARLLDEYKGPQGGFARLMYGDTEMKSRRMMQLSFNRPSSYPKVLVAQSVVGREGLNLHKACRTVVLLHPEWNPGVVEQQIGRVDRVGSHWETQLNKAIEDDRPINELPRIDVLPVIFRGTYDEYNWKVLRERWDDLRSQLHGIVSPLGGAAADLEQQLLFAEIAKSAPNFSPSRRQ
jgi:hypothetical protein